MNARSLCSLGLLVLMVGASAAQPKASDSLVSAYSTVASSPAASTADSPPLGSCQGDTAGEVAAAAEQQRKEYIKRVLSKSAGKSSGIDLRGRQLVRAGSGFFLAEDGTLITNFRVVDGCALISVSPAFGEISAAMPIGSDRTADLALLRTDATPPGIASFTGSNGALNGQATYVIGYPSLGTMTAEPTLTSVRILGTQKTVFSVSTIVIKGAVRSGNNGSALLDSSGGVVGIVVANTTQTYAATGGDVDSVGLAVPNETVQEFLHKNGVEDRAGLKLPPKSGDRLFIDARTFMAQVGCWQ